MKLTRDTITESIARIGPYGLVSSGLVDYLLDQAGGAITVNSDMIFTNELGRDSYFASNPDKLVDGQYVTVGGVLQRWDEAEGKWDDISAVIAGPEGEKAANVVFQYSATGNSNWSTVLNPSVHKYWRWSIDGGLTFSADGVSFTGGDSATFSSKFGLFNYNNSVITQNIPGGVWTTLQNDALGNETYTQYSPPDINRMLDPATGRVMLDELQVGDEVYIRHTVNVIPNTNLTSYTFSHYFGEGATAYRLPIGIPALLDEGAGVPTGVFLIDTHFFIKDDNAKMIGMLPQILVSNDATIEYTGCYISVTRR